MRASTLACALAACAAFVGMTAVPAQAGREAVGGGLLDSPGVVVQPLPGAPALPTGLTAGSWLVADADSGQVLAAKAAHRKFLPASTLKTLTAVTLLPVLDPNQLVRATDADASVDGSKVGLVPGMRYTVSSLFTAMLVVSGNDAADALADAAGGVQNTVGLMNDVAHHLQADDTVARTPSGLDAPGESSSAYDLALIARAGLAMPEFRHYVGIVRSSMPAPHRKHFQIYTHNHLLTTYRGDIGVKNGYTVAAGATYVGAATRGHRTIVITLMHAPADFWPQARALLDWGFRADGNVVPVGTLVDPLRAPSHEAGVAPASQHHIALAAQSPGAGSGVNDWEIAALAGSAALAVAVTTRRLRRRASRARMPLPPL
jgi:D-alanyl-D-alanine carboxypeptidase (penicillin-binding protein 5/6)